MTERPKFSPSSIGTYNNCPVLWEYSYIDGLKSKVRKQYFDIGTYFHELAHHLYRAIESGIPVGSDALYSLMQSRMQQDVVGLSTENVKIMSTVFKMMKDYVFRQSPEIDREIKKIQGVEATLTLDVTTPRGHDVTLEGIADLVYYTLHGGIVLRDHKTGTRNVYSSENLAINPQILFYYTLLVKLGLPAEKVQISYINSYPYKDRSKQPYDNLFAVSELSPSKQVVESFWDYLLNRIDTIIETPPQPNYGQQCGTCPFKIPCTMRLNGQDPTYYLSGQYDVADRSYTIPVTWRETNKSSSKDANQHSSSLEAFKESISNFL